MSRTCNLFVYSNLGGNIKKFTRYEFRFILKTIDQAVNLEKKSKYLFDIQTLSKLVFRNPNIAAFY